MPKLKQKQPRRDTQQEITNQIIEMLENGVKPWSRPWSTSCYEGYALRHNGEAYRGINIMLLDMACMAGGFHSAYWMTFRQAKEYGGSVRKGEKGTAVFKAGTFTKKIELENPTSGDPDQIEQQLPYLRSYTVFNADQIDGLPEQFYANAQAAVSQNKDMRRDDIEAFFRAQLADIRYGGNRAFYRPSDDFIQMPCFDQFKSASAFYATQAHEYTHWTNAEHRLNRNFGPSKFGNKAYAKEELVAELGAFLVAKHFGFENHEREDHAAYIGSWLKALRNDKREIFRAAAHAQRAFDFLLNNATPQQIGEAA